MMKNPEPDDNNVLASGSRRCKTMRVNTVRVELEGEEIAILKRVRAFGFSSNAEVLRLATLAWTDHAARLAAEGQAPLDRDGLNSTDFPSTSNRQRLAFRLLDNGNTSTSDPAYPTLQDSHCFYHQTWTHT